MPSTEILILGLALSVDAAVVTFALSLLHERDLPKIKIKNGLIISLIFGLFQFGMLWLGSYAGYLFTFSSFGYYFQLAVGFIFFGLAFKCVLESSISNDKKIEWGIFPVLILAFATSLDALASGVSLATLPMAHYASLEVGIITFLFCGLFYFIGQFFKKIPDRWLLLFAALIFILLGGQIFWDLRYLFLKGQL